MDKQDDPKPEPKPQPEPEPEEPKVPIPPKPKPQLIDYQTEGQDQAPEKKTKNKQ